MRSNTIAVWAAFSIVGFLFLWQQLQATRLGYEVEGARAQLRRQRDRNAYLRLELARLRSLDRVAVEARDRLKMGPPSPEHIVFLGRRPGDGYLSLLVRER